jgi:cbb3-type cytochrome oxidase subunit 3
MKSLADVVSAAGLSRYAEIALLIFVLVFVAVALRALLTNRAALDRASQLPLDDEPASISHTAASGSER